MTEKGIDICYELQKLKFTSVSKVGKEQQKVLGKRTIQGFLEQRALREELSKKIALSVVSSKQSNNIDDDIKQLSNDNDVVFGETPLPKGNVVSHSKQPKKQFHHYIRLLQKQHRDLIRNNNNSTSPYTKRYQHKKNYSVNYELIEQLKKQRSKIPESCSYNPNYNSINPHVPYVKLQPLKDKPKRMLSLELKENDSIVQSLPSSEYREVKRRIKVIPFEKYSPRSDIVPKDLRRERTVLEPIKFKKKVSVPNFRKMLSRNKVVFNVLGRMQSLVDYTPNYNAIHFNAMGYNKGDINLYHKKVLVKRIWTSYDVSSDYVVAPKLNEG